jgi:hypothetical protein
VAKSVREDQPKQARAQRRVVDAYGNSRASHDNFEIRRPEWIQEFEEPDQAAARRAVLYYLATRPFITGAGYVSHEGTHFAQKVQTLTSVSSYGYFSSVYRNASEDGTGARFEVRCGDINISPWATQVRVGSAALFLTMVQTPIMNKLREEVPNLTGDDEVLGMFERFNSVRFDTDGNIIGDRDLAAAISFQETVTKLMQEELPKFIDLPLNYRLLLGEKADYIKDFWRVLRHEALLSDLADRSDFAAKFTRIFDLIEKARVYGIDRKPDDELAMATDMRYDLISVSPDSGGKPFVKFGHGHKLRQKGAFRMGINEDHVRSAVKEPPKKTRAATRGNAIKQGGIEAATWHSVKGKGDLYATSFRDVWIDEQDRVN